MQAILATRRLDLATLYRTRGKHIFKRSLWNGISSATGLLDERYTHCLWSWGWAQPFPSLHSSLPPGERSTAAKGVGSEGTFKHPVGVCLRVK